MSLAGLVWLWFALAIGCVLAGLVLTGKRVAMPSASKRAMPSASYARGTKDEKKGDVCSRCAQPLESDARFCGACGLYLSCELEPQKIARRR